MATILLRNTLGRPLTNTEVDNNFINLNTDKYEDGDNITVGSAVVADDLSVSGQVAFSTQATISAGGSDQTSATALTASFNIITNANANEGVKLPDVNGGRYVIVINDTTTDITVYPYTGESIVTNGVTLPTNTGVELRAGKALTLVGASTTKWNSFATASEIAIYDSTGTRLN